MVLLQCRWPVVATEAVVLAASCAPAGHGSLLGRHLERSERCGCCHWCRDLRGQVTEPVRCAGIEAHLHDARNRRLNRHMKSAAHPGCPEGVPQRGRTPTLQDVIDDDDVAAIDHIEALDATVVPVEARPHPRGVASPDRCTGRRRDRNNGVVACTGLHDQPGHLVEGARNRPRGTTWCRCTCSAGERLHAVLAPNRGPAGHGGGANPPDQPVKLIARAHEAVSHHALRHARGAIKDEPNAKDAIDHHQGQPPTFWLLEPDREQSGPGAMARGPGPRCATGGGHHRARGMSGCGPSNKPPRPTWWPSSPSVSCSTSSSPSACSTATNRLP